MLSGLAKKCVEEFVKTGKIIAAPEDLAPEMAEKSGVFVCLKKKGELRGCVGTFLPCCENVAVETIRNAISAATQDPRFLPVAESELDDLTYTVDVLTAPEKVESTAELDPVRFGVIVVSGRKKGLLLPDIEGVNTVEEQLRIARMKAGILPGEKAEIFRFRVKRYGGGEEC